MCKSQLCHVRKSKTPIPLDCLSDITTTNRDTEDEAREPQQSHEEPLAAELRFPFNESLHGTRRRGRHYAHSPSSPPSVPRQMALLSASITGGLLFLSLFLVGAFRGKRYVAQREPRILMVLPRANRHYERPCWCAGGRRDRDRSE